jgi:hypothetical protein
MSRIGPNHDGNSFGLIGADFITFNSMLRIPVDFHNIARRGLLPADLLGSLRWRRLPRLLAAWPGVPLDRKAGARAGRRPYDRVQGSVGPPATDGRQLEQIRDATLSRTLSVTLSSSSKSTGKAHATKFMTALKGRNIPAQGNALGNEAKTDEPCRGGI